MADYQLRQPGATIQEAIDIALQVQDDLAAEEAAREQADSLLATKSALAAEEARAKQAEALLATISSLNAEIARATGVEDALQSLIDAIEERIPSSASASNQLADKAFVNSTAATNTATYISNNGGPFTSVAQLEAYTGPHDNNDYAFVVSTDAAGNTVYSRYKFDGTAWAKEYDLNNSSFTAAQWAAINSGITAALKDKLQALPTNAALQEALDGKQGVIADLDTIRANAAAVAYKTDKPSSATEGNFAKFDENRNPVDAGYSASRIHRDLGYNAAQKTITLTAGETGKYVKCSTRAAVANNAFNISAPFDVEACSELLIKTGYNPSDSSHASLDISVIAIYEEMERTRTIQKKNASNQPLYYEVDEDGNPTTTETTTVTDYPVYTTETYTEHRYLPNNEDRWVAIPDSGYYVANIPQSCKCVISYKPGITDTTVVVVKHGALANLTSQIFGIYEHRTMAEAVVSLATRLEALESRLPQPGNIKVGKIDAVTITRYLYPEVLEQDGAPSATVRPTNIDDALPWDGIPVYPGQRLHDNTNKKVYEAFAPCTAISDWVLLN